MLSGAGTVAYKSGMDTRASLPELPPHRPITFAPVDIVCDTIGGGLRLSARAPLSPYDPSLGRMFRAAVEAQPDRVFLAERAGGEWRTLTYGACRRRIEARAP
jgi:feruloyl-CoA synthase